MNLESYDVVKGNVGQSDHALEMVIRPRWYSKDKALEMCARSLGMLKDTMHVTTSEETLAVGTNGKWPIAAPSSPTRTTATRHSRLNHRIIEQHGRAPSSRSSPDRQSEHVHPRAVGTGSARPGVP